MEQKYTLKSGKEIDLESLKQHEVGHIGMLEECINSCINHNRTDYFRVYRKAFGSIQIGGSKKQLERLFNSSYYQVVGDLVSRYWDKCFSEQ